MPVRCGGNFYLKHNFEKAYSDLGTPYIQENCNIAESDNLVIYGHHIKGGNLENYLNIATEYYALPKNTLKEDIPLSTSVKELAKSCVSLPHYSPDL